MLVLKQSSPAVSPGAPIETPVITVPSSSAILAGFRFGFSVLTIGWVWRFRLLSFRTCSWDHLLAGYAGGRYGAILSQAQDDLIVGSKKSLPGLGKASLLAEFVRHCGRCEPLKLNIRHACEKDVEVVGKETSKAESRRSPRSASGISSSRPYRIQPQKDQDHIMGLGRSSKPVRGVGLHAKSKSQCIVRLHGPSAMPCGPEPPPFGGGQCSLLNTVADTSHGGRGIVLVFEEEAVDDL